MNRRTWNLAWLSAALPLIGGGLAACSSTAPALRWYRLRSDLPAGEAMPPSPAAAGKPGRVWELSSTLPMPELLERDTLQVEEGVAGVRMLHGHRWAEPLRDALPRLLRQDLALWLPGLWPAPAPPNVVVTGRLQVEVLALQGSLPRRHVVAAARWVATPAAAAGALDTAPRAFQAEETVPWVDGSPESLVVAQRLAMWRLARRIAAQLGAV